MLPEWASVIAYKLAGAAVGSGIAAWFRKSLRWAFQTVSGVFVGYVSVPPLLDYMTWPMTTDYILFAASIMGVVGYSILEGVLSIDFKALARWWSARKAGAAENQ